MAEEIPVFEEYPAPGGGAVIGYDEGCYLVRMPDGRVIGVAAQGVPSAAAAGADFSAATAPASRKGALLSRLATRRYEVETSGVTLDGVRIGTDRRDQAMLAGAITFCNLEAQAVIDWKASNGWQQLGETGLRAIALEVGRHVQACFSRERQLAEAIDATTTHAALDSLALEVEAFELS
jgi:hypothetical protein